MKSLLAALAVALAATAAAAAEDTSQVRVIVKYRADSTLMQPLAAGPARRPLHAAAMSQRLGLAMKDRWALGPRMQSISATGITAAELARRLAAQPDVEWAEPVRRKVAAAATPNDPYYPGGQTTITPTVGQWYLRAPDATIVSATNAIGAWALTTGSPAVTVAVLDTGVRFEHPDFLLADGTSKLWPGYDFIADTTTAGDGGGRDADATDPGDFSSSAGCSRSSSWHGTQTAGIVGAATDNGIGMAGLGRDVRVLPVRVLGKCGGFDDDIIAGMLWAAGLGSSPVANPHPAKVLNMSLGGAGSCSAAYQSAFDQLVAAGVTVVVAAGNDEGLAVSEPANCNGALAVAGIRHVGTKVGFSNVGTQVAIAAPGGNCVNLSGACLYPILTTTNSGVTGPGSSTYSNSFNASVGTSFAAPQVAAVVGLMLSVAPGLSPAEIKSTLQATARPFPTPPPVTSTPVCHAPNGLAQDECYCTTSTCGAGMLDASAAVAKAQGVAQGPLSVISKQAQTATVGNAFAIDGAVSSRSVTRYAWSIVSGATPSELSGASNAVATLTPVSSGTVVVRLDVEDAAGATATTTAAIPVSTAPLPIISPAAPTVAVGSNATIGASSSQVATGRTISTYRWSITSGDTIGAIRSGASSESVVVSGTAIGTFTLELQVTDSAGAVSTATKTVAVVEAPAPTTTSGSSGGGAFGATWLALLCAGVAALSAAGRGRSSPRSPAA